MKLVIHAHALKNESLSQSITAQFDERGGTIGRSDTNTLTLPDPERHVSRLQAEVLCTGRSFNIRNVGSANPIELNGRALRPGEGAPLAPGDQLVIGGYAMRVTAGDVTPASAALTPRIDSRTVIRASAGEVKTDPPRSQPAAARGASNAPAMRPPPASPSDPFADLMGNAGAPAASDPFADLMNAAPPPAPAVRSPSAGRTVASPPARLPDDFDPFADANPQAMGGDADLAAFMEGPPGDRGQLPVRPSAPPPTSDLDDLLGLSKPGGAGPAASSLDTMFGLGGHGEERPDGDPLDDFLTPTKGSKASGIGAADVLDLFGPTNDRATSPTAPAAFNHTPELAGAYSPPVVKPGSPAPAVVPSPPRAGRPPAPTSRRDDEPARARFPATAPAPLSPRTPAVAPPSSAAASQDASPEALWRAFCEGSGISLQLPQGLNPQTMRVMGQLLHHAVEGAMKLMSARAAAKQELRAQVTTIQSKNNNPLKFSVDPQQALAQLLQPPMRGFMAGPDAVRDAMDDLLGHNIGTMAGTRAALQGMLNRFEPARLEAKLTNKGVIDAVLPMNRRAKLWELYVEHFQQVQDEAQDDFHELFGKAFVKAYEQQIDRLEASRRKP